MPIRLNLGCGWDRINGYANIDVNPEVQPDIIADVSNLAQIPDECVDEIWASHVLEHFPCWIDVLGEWHRLLKPGGLITVCVPDILTMYSMAMNGAIDLRMFNAGVFGATQLGDERETMEHHQVFTMESLVQRMKPYFPDATPIEHATVRDRFLGEAMVSGHKEGGDSNGVSESSDDDCERACHRCTRAACEADGY